MEGAAAEGPPVVPVTAPHVTPSHITGKATAPPVPCQSPLCHASRTESCSSRSSVARKASRGSHSHEAMRGGAQQEGILWAPPPPLSLCHSRRASCGSNRRQAEGSEPGAASPLHGVGGMAGSSGPSPDPPSSASYPGVPLAVPHLRCQTRKCGCHWGSAAPLQHLWGSAAPLVMVMGSAAPVPRALHHQHQGWVHPPACTARGAYPRLHSDVGHAPHQTRHLPLPRPSHMQHSHLCPLPRVPPPCPQVACALRLL